MSEEKPPYNAGDGTLEPDLDIDDEQVQSSGWLEHWLCVGHVSDVARQAIENLGGRVIGLSSLYIGSPRVYTFSLLYSDPPDDDQCFTISEEEYQNKTHLQLDVYSADGHEEFVIYSSGTDIGGIQASVDDLHLVTLGEWYEIADKA